MGIEEIFDQPLEPVVEAPQIPEPAPAPIETPEPAPVEPPAAEPPVVEDPKDGHTVPLATALDWRDGKKAAERERDEARAALAAKDPPSTAPDPYDDPQGFAAHNAQQVQQAVLKNKFEMSDVIARQTHGKETVEAATEWAMERAKNNPAFAAEYMREAHPIDWVVRQHKRDGLLSQIGDDPDEYVRRRAAELGLSAPMVPAPVVTATQQAPVTPPRSLASQPSLNGGVKDIPTGPLAALEAVFNR